MAEGAPHAPSSETTNDKPPHLQTEQKIIDRIVLLANGQVNTRGVSVSYENFSDFTCLTVSDCIIMFGVDGPIAQLVRARA